MDKSLLSALVIFIGIFIASLLLLRRRSDFTNGIEQYSSRAVNDLNKLNSATLNKFASGKSSFYQKLITKISNDLDESQIAVSAVRWLSVLLLGSAVILAVLSVLLGLPLYLSAIIAIVFGVLFHLYFIDRAQKKIIKEFQEEFPEALMSISGAISAGLSFEQGLEATAQQGSSQLSKQFQRALNDMDLGASIEDALGQVAVRTKSADMDWLIDAISISRETGTSVAPVLNTVASSIQERAQLRREIQSLTAEGMLSAYVVVSLPFVIFAFLIATQPNYVKFFWTEPIGMVMGVSALALIAVGWFWLKSIVNVKE